MKKQILFTAFIFLAFVSIDFGQNKQNARKPVAPKTVSDPQTSTPENKANQNLDTPETPSKKNERHDDTTANQIADPTNDQRKDVDRNVDKTKNISAKTMPFAYEFSQPKFNIGHVLIEHDTNGKGRITFRKKELNESLTDPITTSAEAFERIKNLWNELDFFNSTENYQSEKQFPHLGTMKLFARAGEKQREVEFNWTENKIANDLTNEYKRITEQSIWMFEMNLARENQPLGAPQLINRLETMVNRNQISDAKQMLPFLREIVDDERLPLIARNQTAKIVKQIEKRKP